MPVQYDSVTSIQQAINMAVAENRVVRFISDKPNMQLRKEIDDIKGCKLLKKSKDSNDIAVVPPSITNFDFEDIDTTLILSTKERRTPGGLYLP